MSNIEIRREFQELESSRKEVIRKLKELRDNIQEEERRHNIGKVTYSSTGIIAAGLTIAGIAAAPFTFGASLELTIAGAATGAVSGIAGFSHSVAANVIIRNKCEEAQTLLENYQSKVFDFWDFIVFGVQLKGIISNTKTLIESFVTLRSHYTASTATSVVSASLSRMQILGIIASGVGIVKNMYNIYTSSCKIAGNTRHDKVKELDEVIKALELQTFDAFT
jgi:apolipoprotein L